MNWLAAPREGGDRAAPSRAPSYRLRSRTLPSKWIFLLRWMSSSVLFMDCTLALHSCTSWGDQRWVTCSAPYPGSQSPASGSHLGTRDSEGWGSFRGTQGFRGGPWKPDIPRPAELTSLSALKALVAMSSSSEPCAVRFRMFWRAGSAQ